MEPYRRIREKRVILPCLALFLGLFCVAAQAAEVYRWVDENGDVHYTETLPPDMREKSHDVLNERGIVTDENLSLAPPPPKKKAAKKNELPDLPRDASGMPRPKAQYTKSEMQDQMDNFLLLRYESEQEIVDAMNVEIKQLNYDRRLLQTSRNSTNDAFRGQVRIAAEKQRAGLEVDPADAREIENLQDKLSENQASLDGLRQREDMIRANFQVQLDRYQHLVELSQEEEEEG